MGLSSPVIGRLIDQHGGRSVMSAGAAFNAAGCLAIAVCYQPPLYFLGWILLGLGMRLSLYDVAFAALVRIGGPEARVPMSQITLLGGLASTAFWPVGNVLAEMLGWRGALVGYAVIALATVSLHLTLPNGRYDDLPERHTLAQFTPAAASGRQHFVAAGVYALIVTLTNFLNSGMSAHRIAIHAAVSVATLCGIGQSTARLCEVLFGRRLHPLLLNIIATAILPFSFIAGLFASDWPAVVTFAFFYGAGNGLVTITRGSLPLVLFDHRTYVHFVGRLIAPSFLLSAAAPLTYAMVISRFG